MPNNDWKQKKGGLNKVGGSLSKFVTEGLVSWCYMFKESMHGLFCDDGDDDDDEFFLWYVWLTKDV